MFPKSRPPALQNPAVRDRAWREQRQSHIGREPFLHLADEVLAGPHLAFLQQHFHAGATLEKRRKLLGELSIRRAITGENLGHAVDLTAGEGSVPSHDRCVPNLVTSSADSLAAYRLHQRRMKQRAPLAMQSFHTRLLRHL